MKRNADTHFIHSNLDTDVVVTDSPAGEFDIPRELFHILERLCLGRKRIFLQFEGQRIEKDPVQQKFCKSD